MKTLAYLAAATISIAGTSLLTAADPSASRPKSDVDWIHVDRESWLLLAEEPEHHLADARTAIDAGQHAEAAQDLRIASEMLDQRQQTLEKAQEILDDAAAKAADRGFGSVAELDNVTNDVLATLKGDAARVPVGVAVTEILAAEPAYHMARARENFLEKDNKAAAVDVRKAAVYMELNSENAAKKKEAPAVKREAADLQQLADQIAAGTVNSVASLDKAFQDAKNVLSKAA